MTLASKFILAVTVLGSALLGGAASRQYKPTKTFAEQELVPQKAGGLPNCFPAIGFKMPLHIPHSVVNWWCDYDTEYAFMGFRGNLEGQSLEQLRQEFLDIRHTFKGRYVRLYGACDRNGFYDDIVDAAWRANLGVHALIWFGWDDPDIWKTRRDVLLAALHANPKAKFVTRVLQFGSEPLFDWALPPLDLAEQVKLAQENLTSLRIPVTISEMAWGYQFLTNLGLSQNGWPSTTYPGVEPNSPSAVADVFRQDYYTLLDEKCSYFKTVGGRGIGWFAHIYSDNQEPGYGIYGKEGSLKFPFAPKIRC